MKKREFEPLEMRKRKAIKQDIGDFRPRPTPIEPMHVLFDGDGQGNRRRLAKPTLDYYDRECLYG